VTYGDIVAIRQYIRKGFTSSRSSAGRTCKDSLIAKLRSKLADTGENMEKRKMVMKDNKYAKRNTRRIEVGWLHYESKSNNAVRQVRPAKGGGTRHLMVASDTTVAQVMQSALDIYFPDGVSQKGRLEDFEFSTVNFDLSQVLHTDTISQLYERKSVKMLRLYLHTQHKDCSDAQGIQHSDESTPADSELQCLKQHCHSPSIPTQAELNARSMSTDSRSLYTLYVYITTDSPECSSACRDRNEEVRPHHSSTASTSLASGTPANHLQVGDADPQVSPWSGAVLPGRRVHPRLVGRQQVAAAVG